MVADHRSAAGKLRPAASGHRAERQCGQRVIQRTVIAWGGGGKRPISRASWDVNMTLGTILVILLILLLVGAVPRWGYSRGWGYGPPPACSASF
jgi:hypothetical protein